MAPAAAAAGPLLRGLLLGDAAVVEAGAARAAAPPVRSGMDLYRRLQAASEAGAVLETGCRGLDDLLGGGLRAGQVHELVGASPAGKTQVCLAAAASCAAAGLAAVYVSLQNAFSVARVAQLLRGGAARRPDGGPGLERALAHLRAAELAGAEELVEFLHALLAHFRWLRRNGGGAPAAAEGLGAGVPRLLVVDCPAIPLAAAMAYGDGQLQGHALMVGVGGLLKTLADEFDIAVLVTNVLVGGEARPRPSLGEAWRCQVHVRVALRAQNVVEVADRPGEAEEALVCEAVLQKSPTVAAGAVARFRVTGEGLLDEPAPGAADGTA